MNKTHRLLPQFLAAVLMALAGNAHAQPLSAVGDNWCPYNCDPAGGPRGYMMDVLERIVGREPGLLYRIEPWTRALEQVERGDHQLLIATTPSTSPNMPLTAPLGIDRTCFFVREDNPWQYRKPADLKSLRIGVVQDYNYDADGPIDQLVASYRKAKDLRLEVAYGDNALTSNFRKLEGKRMDVVIENENVARYTLRKLKLEGKIRLAGCATHYAGTIHVGISPRQPNAKELAARIDAGVAALRKSGELEKLLSSYGLRDWQ